MTKKKPKWPLIFAAFILATGAWAWFYSIGHSYERADPLFGLSVHPVPAKPPSHYQEDFREGEMENASANILGAIQLFMRRHGHAPSSFSQIRALVAALAKPDKMDPSLHFTWTEPRPYKDKDDPGGTYKRTVITVTAPDHPTVTMRIVYSKIDETVDSPPGVDY